LRFDTLQPLRLPRADPVSRFAMAAKRIRLLAFDGGGVRGLSSLYILQGLMRQISADGIPPKPCEYFDMICGTSTGGLIAIMLGRLRMSVEECINRFLRLSTKIFKLKHPLPIGLKGQVKGRFDAKNMNQVLKEVITECNIDADALLKDTDPDACKVCGPLMSVCRTQLILHSASSAQ
jgi:predicted acylesterase/phospholipase RssA